MRLILVLLALSAATFAGEETDAKAKKETPAHCRMDPGLKLPVAKSAKKLGDGFGAVVNLNALGQIALGDKRGSLDALKKSLSELVKKHGEMEGPASTMRVLLRVDRDAPWLHVQWAMTICAECRIRRIELGVQQKDGTPGRLDSWLPMIPGGRAKPEEMMWIKVHVFGRKEKARDFAGFQVMTPTHFLYRSGDQTLEDLDAVAKRIRAVTAEAKKAKIARRGEIKAGHKVPFDVIVGVLDEFRVQKLDRVDYYGTALPSKGVRTGAQLPYPKRNYVRR
ncbi:MAG: biopolymer transporter ExbD [Planctomycetota bacterium]